MPVYPTLVVYTPVHPWVHHHPSQCTHRRPAPSSRADVRGERALGSSREKDLGERHLL